MDKKKEEKYRKGYTRLILAINVSVIYMAGLLLFNEHSLMSLLLILPLSYFCYLLYKSQEVELQCLSKKK